MANEQYDLGVAIWDFGGDNELAIGTVALPTKGGITATIEETTWSPTYDQTGETPRDVIKTGERAEITVNMAAFNLEAFAKIFPAARLITDATDPNKKKVVFGGKVGESLLPYARKLTIRPITLFDEDDPDLGDASQDITFPKAIPRANFSITFAANTERVYPVVFQAIYDDTENAIVIFGDLSATS
ncbi:MAG: hypothetical protein BAA04_04845 [Firmicutes bacterium ZCTH02-B6]|nr:MAG: hypothetical protein BAA04_04845 [Firmicutes bacterium ZCTH02-B6]